MRWHGGKYYLASWLHSLAPASVADDPKNGYTHRNIVFAGGLGEFGTGSRLMASGKPSTIATVSLQTSTTYLPTPLGAAFVQRLNLTPLSDSVWQSSRNTDADDPVAAAAAFFIKYRQSRQGLGKDYVTPTSRTRRGMNEQVSAFLSAVEGLPECHKRLRLVEIRNLDFAKFIGAYDHSRALFYCDPPYVHATRATVGEYGDHEMSQSDHQRLLATLASIKGRFMLSGYPSDLYDQAAQQHGWRRHEKLIDAKSSSSKEKPKRIECVWTNY